MSKSITPLFYVAAAAAIVGIGVSIEATRRQINTVDEGAAYLAQRGYTAISGGERDFVNACGENIFARHYKATDPDGKKVGQTVCFNPLIGRHLPIL